MGAARDRSRLLLFALVILLVAASAAAALSSGGVIADDSQPVATTQKTPDSLKTVTVDGNSSERLWPYTSRRESYDSATLPINVVVLKDAADVRYLLTSTTSATWQVSESSVGQVNRSSTANATEANATRENESNVESGVVLNGTNIEWTSARGSTRYTYVHNQTTGEGYWIDETYQLHDGTYLGTRYHLRLYEGGSGTDRWTAIQAHREHWDWFRLRHTVDSVDRAQDYVEREFFGTWFLDEIARVRFANAGALDSDGWVSRIRLVDRGLIAPIPQSLTFVIGVLAVLHRLSGLDRAIQALRRRLAESSIDPYHLPLAASLALFPLLVRVSGITLERAFPTLSPKVFAAVLYLVLVVGIPACTVGCSRRLPVLSSAIVSFFALGGGMLLDYAYLNISFLAIDVVVHRTVLLVAVGLLAAGGSRSSPGGPSRHRLVVFGAVLWIVGLAVPLLDLY